MPCATTNMFSGKVFLWDDLVGFSEDLVEICLGRWMEWMGVACPLAGSWDCLVAGTAVPGEDKRAFLSRTRACWEVSWCLV